MTTKMPTCISDTIGLLKSWMREKHHAKLRYDVTAEHRILHAGVISQDINADWMNSNHAEIADWMLSAGVTEIIVTQEGATWR